MGKTTHIIILVVSLILLFITVPAMLVLKYNLNTAGNVLLIIDIGLVVGVIISIVKLKTESKKQ